MIRLALIAPRDRLPHYAAVAPRLPQVQFCALVSAGDSPDTQVVEGLGRPLICGSLDELLNEHDASVDAVVLHAPLAQRAELVKRCVAVGKHVLVDAPFAGTSEEASKLATTCQSAGVQMALMRPLRFMPFGQTVKARLTAGELGAPGLVRIHHWRATGNELGSAESLQAGRPSSSASLTGRGREAVRGNEEMVQLVFHELDLVCWLFDASPTSVYAVGNVDAANEASYAQIHLGFPEGGMALVDCQQRTGPGATPYYSLSVIGSHGAAYADDHHNMNLLLKDQNATALNVGQGLQHLHLQIQDFVDSILVNGLADVFDAYGQRALAVAEAAAASLSVRRAAHWEVDRYELR